MAYTDIDKPSDYFNTSLWTGNGSTQSITGVGFEPDWVWIKSRTGTYSGSDHHIYDVIRGANVKLSSNSTGGNATISDTLTSFDSDGYSLGFRTRVNGTGTTYAGWNWLADNTSGSSNTDGDVTSTVSVNTTSGFSIVKWLAPGTSTAINVGHGLGVAPKVLITKCLGAGSSIIAWYVYHESLGNSQTIYLNGTDAAVSNSTIWNATTPTSTVFKHNSGGDNLDYVSYCFAEKKGFSKFGSYTGNGNADGTFVYTGFKPAFILQKRTDSTGHWGIYDNKRDDYNVATQILTPSTEGAEATYGAVDFLSNGFKWRTTESAMNASGSTFIYMAIAEHPFTTSTGIPCTAR